MLSLAVLSLFLTISGKLLHVPGSHARTNDYRLLDKIAKDIMVCENQTIRKWPGSIGEYKNHLRKKMMAAGAV